MTDPPQTPASPDPDLSQLYRLAEGIVEAVTQPAPDWVRHRARAQGLAGLIQDRCATADGL